MEKRRKPFFTAKNIAFLAVLVALVVVLQIWGGYIRIGATSLSFVLVPIVLGAVLLGPLAGAFLGFVFGLIVLIYGITGVDGFTYILFADHPVLTSALCLVKGIAAGLVAGLLFKPVSKKNPYAGVFVASVSAPIVNTGLFILGGPLMSGTLEANFVADGSTVIYFLIIGCAGVNFLVEFAINAVASPAIYTVMRVVGKTMKKKAAKKPAAAIGAGAPAARLSEGEQTLLLDTKNADAVLVEIEEDLPQEDAVFVGMEEELPQGKGRGTPNKPAAQKNGN